MSRPCFCINIPCGCAANLYAEAIGASPEYLQQDGARWATAAAVYEELNSDDREIQEYHVHLNQHSGHSYQNHGHAHPMNGVVHPHSGHAHQSSGHTHESSGHPYHHHAHTHHSMVHTYHSKPRPKSRSECHSPVHMSCGPEDDMVLKHEKPSRRGSLTAITTIDKFISDAYPTTHSSVPSLHKVSSLNRSLAGTKNGERAESNLELEAVAAMHELAFAVQSISFFSRCYLTLFVFLVSEMLPRTPEIIFVNVTTLEGQPYCLELTLKGWRIASLRSDCMIGDFTKMELFINYYDSLYDLMDAVSPGYRQRFGEKLAKKLIMLQELDDHGVIAPTSSYGSPMSVSSADRQSSESIPIVTPVPSPVPEQNDCPISV